MASVQRAQRCCKTLPMLPGSRVVDGSGVQACAFFFLLCALRSRWRAALRHSGTATHAQQPAMLASQRVGSLAARPCRLAAPRRAAAATPRRRCCVSASGDIAALPERPPRPKYYPGRIDDPTYVRIFDTTLRDGEQSPGATLTSKEKLDIARQLAKLGVDIIEAGFPIASPDDLNAVRQIAKEVGQNVDEHGYVPVICGLSRANKVDIDAAWEGVRHALRPRVHTFIATSKIHMEYKLRKTPDEVLEIAVNAVKYARSLGCEDIEFSPEDAGRSDPEFLYRILTAVVDAGATTINIPDTTGWNLPQEFGGLIGLIKANVNVEGRCIISTHCQARALSALVTQLPVFFRCAKHQRLRLVCVLCPRYPERPGSVNSQLSGGRCQRCTTGACPQAPPPRCPPSNTAARAPNSGGRSVFTPAGAADKRLRQRTQNTWPHSHAQHAVCMFLLHCCLRGPT